MGLAWGTVVGGIFFVVIQIPALVRYKFRYRPTLAMQLPGVVEVIRLMGPRIVTLGVIQFADLFIIRLASGLPVGATSAYFYAYALMQFPQTLFGTAIALVVFPTLAELYNAHNLSGLRRTAGNTLAIIWTLTIPAAAATVLLGEPIIAVLFQGGAFDEAATQLVYAILAVFSIRIVSESTLEVVARLFYARHNTRTPMLAYLGWLVVTVAFSFFLVDRMGVSGLALATTIGFTLLAGVLFELNRRELGGLGGRALQLTFFRALAGTLGLTVVIWLIGQVIISPFPFILVGGVAGALTYMIITWLLGGRELVTLWHIARNRSKSEDLPL
jgi:putative peptidoglycan lipid II flippase